ncbi:MAG: hypothetical protein IPJ30_13885 [Acidobacteria bacterium]|nr:hypothetical protein [Acidobacteriota bacterium]
MHTDLREAAVRYGAQMPASRIIINSPLAPSMTLGCGSWGGNVTSDNVSPLHLMDVKRVAFETKPVSAPRPKVKQPNSANVAVDGSSKRAEIAALVDKFLSRKIAETAPETVVPEIAPEKADGPVKTIIHELRPHQGRTGTDARRR